MEHMIQGIIHDERTNDNAKNVDIRRAPVVAIQNQQ
jgi:hypothetical protein